MSELNLDLIKTLFLRFTSIFGERFKKNFETPQMFEMWCEDWLEGLTGIAPEHIKEALDYCRFNLDWSPSLAQFRTYCEKAAGFPTMLEAKEAAIRRDFHHPIIQICYDTIGSWDMHRMSEKDLTKRFAIVYEEERAKMRTQSYRDHVLLKNERVKSINQAGEAKKADRFLNSA